MVKIQLKKLNKMEELKISIESLQQEKQRIENKVDDFSRYGRSPNDDDYENMMLLLIEWKKIKSNIYVLQQCLDAVISNAQ